MKHVICAAALAIGLAAVPAVVSVPAPAFAQEAAARPDELVWTEAGKVQKKPGRIESADHDKVVFTVQGGKKVEIPALDVTEMRWSDAPADYESGVRALASGDAAAAKRAFTDAIREKDVKTGIRDWVTEYANAGLGRALVALGEFDKAAEAFAKARSANAKSMVLDQILLGLAEAELGRGKGDAAAKAADDLVAAAKTAKRPAWELTAYLAKARGKLASGDFGGAGQAFDDAASFSERAAAAEKNEAAKRRLLAAGVDAAASKGWALVAKAESTKASGDFDAARSYFDSLASKMPNEPIVRASALNAAGVAKLAGGDAKSALRLFQEAEVVHFRASNEVARSLWYQAECWKKLGNEKDRAERLKDLRMSFPGSEWARRAQ